MPHTITEPCIGVKDTACVDVCPVDCIYGKGEDFEMLFIHPEECIGCKACLASCPYDARFIHPEGYADKCTFCIHRVKEGKDPACVAVCPTRCMHFGDLDDPHSEVSRLLAARANHALIPEAGTKPRIFYLT